MKFSFTLIWMSSFQREQLRQSEQTQFVFCGRHCNVTWGLYHWQFTPYFYKQLVQESSIKNNLKIKEILLQSVHWNVDCSNNKVACPYCQTYKNILGQWLCVEKRKKMARVPLQFVVAMFACINILGYAEVQSGLLSIFFSFDKFKNIRNWIARWMKLAKALFEWQVIM